MTCAERHRGKSKLLGMLLGMATCCLAIRPAEAVMGLAETNGRSIARYTKCRRVSARLTLPVRFLSDTRWEADFGSVVSSGSYVASSKHRRTVVPFTLDDASRAALRTEMQRRISAACGGRAVALQSVTVRAFRGRISKKHGSLSVSLTVGLAGADGRGSFRYRGRGRLGPLPTTTTSTTSTIPTTSSTSVSTSTTTTLPPCGNGTRDGNEGPVDCAVTTEAAHAVSGTIGFDGGSLTTTASDGTVYTLDVPSGSLSAAAKITMTPVTDIEGYPLAAGVAAGVDLEPSGLVFTVPAILTIETAAAGGAGTTPIAILYEGDAASFELSFLGSDAGRFTIPILHFSGGTAGFATAQELAEIIQREGTPCLIAAIAPASATPPDVAALQSTYHACFVSDVLPAIEQASDDVQLSSAIGQFIMWKTTTRLALGVEFFTGFDDVAETAQAHDALVIKLRQAIDRNNARCAQDESLAALANVLFWQSQATRFGLDSVAHLLDRATILRDLCAHPVVDNLVVPDDIQVGFPHSLDIQFGLLFNGHQSSKGVPFHVTLVGDGLDIQHPTGFTDAQGSYTTVITATRDGDLSITATGCLVFPGTQTASDVCVEETGTTSAINLDGQWTGTVDVGSAVPACSIINQNQNAISGTIHQFGGSATLLATLSGSQLLGVSIEGFFGEADCTATGSGTVNGDTITLNVTLEAPCNTDVSLTYTFARGGSCL